MGNIKRKIEQIPKFYRALIILAVVLAGALLIGAKSQAGTEATTHMADIIVITFMTICMIVTERVASKIVALSDDASDRMKALRRTQLRIYRAASVFAVISWFATVFAGVTVFTVIVVAISAGSAIVALLIQANANKEKKTTVVNDIDH